MESFFKFLCNDLKHSRFLASLDTLTSIGTGDSMVKNPPANAGDTSLIPGLGRSPGGGHFNLLEYSCLENPMNRGAWWAMVHKGCKELDTTEVT